MSLPILMEMLPRLPCDSPGPCLRPHHLSVSVHILMFPKVVILLLSGDLGRYFGILQRGPLVLGGDDEISKGASHQLRPDPTPILTSHVHLHRVSQSLALLPRMAKSSTLPLGLSRSLYLHGSGWAQMIIELISGLEVTLATA